MKCAKEEICCLNIEIRQLLTFLCNDYVDHYQAVTKHIVTNPLLHPKSLLSGCTKSACTKPLLSGSFRLVDYLDSEGTFSIASKSGVILH